jgi:hypothetical protein
VADGADRDRRQDVCVLGPASPCTSPPFFFSLASACCRPPASPTMDLPSLQACKNAARINCPSFGRMHACVVNGCNYPTSSPERSIRATCLCSANAVRTTQPISQPARLVMSPPQQHEHALRKQHRRLQHVGLCYGQRSGRVFACVAPASCLTCAWGFSTLSVSTWESYGFC